MKTAIFLIFLIILSGQSAAQNYGWITPNKTYLKMYVIEDGMFRIDKNDFIQAGINVSVIDPRTIKVFSMGAEIPVYFEGEQDGVFNDSDYFDFYGTRNYGGLTNTYRDSSGINVVHYTTEEYYSSYSDTNIYWVGWDGNFGLRYLLFTSSSQSNYPSAFHYATEHFEIDSVYSLGETVNPNIDFRYFNTEKVSGEGWYWKNMQNGSTVSRVFASPNLFSPSQTCSFRIFAYPNSRDTVFNEHKLVLRINSTPIATLSRNDYSLFDTSVTFPGSLLSSTGNNTVSVTYTPTFGNLNAFPSLYFDLIEIKYTARFRFLNGRASVILGGNDTSSSLFSFSGFNSLLPAFIYDSRNFLRIPVYSWDSDTLIFTGRNNSSFEISNGNITRKPFRVEARQVPNLVSSSNSANYIIVHNELFSSAAENLRQHRQSRDNFNAIKVSTRDIIDIFNYGIEDPAAIRRFLEHAYSTWQPPRLAYVCLLGRGSLNPKNNAGQPGYFYSNLVPVYGNPPSDGYFANFNFGGFTYYKQVAIARIPAYTAAEAQDMVSKIINYDNQPVDKWWKTFIMITGGPNRNEQILHQGSSNFLVNTYISPPPVYGESHKIYRNDSSGYVTFNYADSIRNEINRGGLVVNFIGHAASQDWEIGLSDPAALSNGNKLPLVLSMTCFTGRNAEVQFRGFGEKFLYYNNKGAVGFLGSTGWSFAGSGNQFNQYVLRSFAQDTTRRIGDMISNASVRLSTDSLSFQARNTINCYDLLGDPATKLLLPGTPEFLFMENDYKLSNPYPIVGELIDLTVYPRNYGLYTMNCLLRFEILKNGNIFRYKDTLLTGFGMYDTANYTFTLDTIGNYSLRVTLDYDNRYPEENPLNNVLTIPLPLRNISFTPFKPINNSALTSDSVEFVGLNPQLDTRSNNIKILLQVDTSRFFSSPVAAFSSSNVSGVITKFRYRLPVPDSGLVYYWRTNSIINLDSTGWSEVRKFVYNPLAGQLNADRRSADSNITVYAKLPGQFEPGELSNVFYNGSGFQLSNFTGQLSAKSYGSNSFQASYFIINSYQIYADGGQNTGLNLAKVSRLTGKLLQFRNFRMSTSTSSDSVLNFLNTYDTTHYLMIFIASFVSPSDSLRQSAKNRIKQFGSRFADSVTRFDEFDTWAFIGYMGADTANVSEEFHNYPTQGCPDLWCPSYANKTPVFLNTSGSINFSLGPSHRWKNFSWNRVLYPNSAIRFDVIGIKTNDDSVVIFSGLTNNALVSLDTLNSYIFPSLRLFCRIDIDTLYGLLSPVFRSMNFKYTPPAELIPDNYSFVKSDSVVDEGDSVTISVRNYNVGFVPANVTVQKWTANSPNGIRLLRADTLYNPFYPESLRVSQITFSTEGLRDRRKAADTVEIYFETSILGNENDYFTYNNFALSQVIVTGDTTGPSIDVTYDGMKILNGDIIQSRPEIIFKFFDQSMLNYTQADTSNIFILLDNARVRYFLGGTKNPQIDFNPVNNGDLKVVVTYRPELSEGRHTLKYIGKDQEGSSDTLTNDVYVSNAFTVKNLFNYPNPMRSDTYFTFDLFAPKNPSSCRIKIYTVAGRLIKEINSPARVGFNQVYWDGRDSDGEHIANGIYIYKLIIEDGEKIETSVQKLAMLK